MQEKINLLSKIKELHDLENHVNRQLTNADRIIAWHIHEIEKQKKDKLKFGKRISHNMKLRNQLINKLEGNELIEYGLDIIKQFLNSKKIIFVQSITNSLYFMINKIEYRISDHPRKRFSGFGYIIEDVKDIDKIIKDIKNRIAAHEKQSK